MEESTRLLYETPVTKVLELNAECAILQMSGPDDITKQDW